jgi:nucleotide-binding universal stress UspA family protein
MQYKTILVHADLSPAAPDRIRLAARLARAADAHLVGSALTGFSRFIPPATLAAGGTALAKRCAALQDAAARALACFRRIAAEEGVDAAEARLIDDDVDGGMAVQARYCDLVVVGQADRGVVAPPLPPPPPQDLPEYLLFTSGRPVLVVPCTGYPPEPGGPALVAWDGSVEATRAVDGALPLLRLASGTIVLGFGDDFAPPDGDPCGQLAAYLKRHGVRACAAGRRQIGADIGERLLSEASDQGASLLVMGGYGHSRFRELLTKGVTATILRTMTLPVLLAH